MSIYPEGKDGDIKRGKRIALGIVIAAVLGFLIALLVMRNMGGVNPIRGGRDSNYVHVDTTIIPPDTFVNHGGNSPEGGNTVRQFQSKLNRVARQEMSPDEFLVEFEEGALALFKGSEMLSMTISDFVQEVSLKGYDSEKEEYKWRVTGVLPKDNSKKLRLHYEAQ